MALNKHYHYFFISLLVIWLAVYFDTLADMVSVWNGSETYTYCFLILPIVLYLVYEKKIQLSATPFQFNGYFLFSLLLVQVGFLFAELASVGFLMHIAAYASIVCLVAMVYGWQVFKLLLFPLFYLIFSVPMGEEFVPALQDITADISVFLVQLAGIPVYREGLYIYIPNGTFEVAEACSGIRFLIAMIAIGTLYSYLFYQSTIRRIIFTLISIVLPILANGVRAFGIVYVGHTTNMEHAVGADHIVYGWVFFSIVLGLLMLIGRLWREDLEVSASITVQTLSNNQCLAKSSFIFPMLFLLLAPVYQLFVVGKNTTPISDKTLIYAQQVGSKKEPIWQPSFQKADEQWLINQTLTDSNIAVYVAVYHQDNQEQELINWSNRIFNIDSFSLVSREKLNIQIAQQEITASVLNLVAISGEKKQLVYWYHVDNTKSSNKLVIKAAQLVNKLAGGTGGGYVVIADVGQGQLTASEIKQRLTKLAWL